MKYVVGVNVNLLKNVNRLLKNGNVILINIVVVVEL